MESKWYLFHGQSLENTNISDRAHALHITKSNWDGIKKHLDRKKLHQEALDKEAANKKYLDDGSKSMTEKWENSLENVRRRKEEERLRLIEQKLIERQERYQQLRKEQEEIRTKYINKVKKEIFTTAGRARDLTSALILSEVLHEREKQIELQKRVKQHEEEVEQKHQEMQEKKAAKEAAEEAEKKKVRKEKHIKHVEELKKTIEEKAAWEKQQREQKAKNEALDNIEAAKEGERYDKLLADDKLRKKRELLEERRKSVIRRRELDIQKIKEDKELDEVVQIYSDTKHRIDCMRKQREIDMRNDLIRHKEETIRLIMAEKVDVTILEDIILKKTVAEREAIENEKAKAKREFIEQSKQDRLKDKDDFLAREAAKKTKEQELKKWELLNRYKADENAKKYEQSRKEQMWQKILKNRQQLTEQIEDNIQEQIRDQKNKDADDALAIQRIKDEDAKFFEYANEVVELAKSKGRITVPIERIITKYVKDFNLDSETLGEASDDSKAHSCSDPKKKLIKPRKSKPCRCCREKA